MKREEYVFKWIFVGEMGVGKTCLIKRWIENNFTANYKSTVGVDFAVKEVESDNNSVFIVQIWDLAGQEVNSFFFFFF